MGRILIIDDEPHMRRIIGSNLRRSGHDVVEANGMVEGKKRVVEADFDAAFVDQRMNDGAGLDFVTFARDSEPGLSIVMLTAVATIELAVDAMRHGAFDFLAKPFEPDVLIAVAQRACERTALLRENDRLRREVQQFEPRGGIFGASEAISRVRDMIERVAPTNSTVLISGETGTGKELVARAIHNSSSRSAKPFIAVNCAAFTETLLESELFGHEKGAFTGADRGRQGLFEAAHEGTLFLDEVGEMSLTAQAKLLRVLTDGQVTRLGSTQPRAVRVRVLVATHRDLLEMAEEGRFRQDLYYRLAVVPIHIPPLRERRDDVPILCEVISQQVARDLKMRQRGISQSAMARLRCYDFPGNVRELRNLIERAYILSTCDELTPESFALSGLSGGDASSGSTHPVCTHCPSLQHLPEEFNLHEFLADVEKTVIANTLSSAGGTQALAARRLGLSRSVLSYKLAKYGVRAPEA